MHATTAWNEVCKSLSPAITEACSAAAVNAGPAALAAELARRIPVRSFREVLCRGGWYRLGGVLAADGSRLADNLEQWAEEQLELHDGDIAVLQEQYAGRGLTATRLSGRTHYLIATIGPEPADFLQLEIEDLQEVRAHTLFDRAPAATTLDELVDARDGAPVATPLGPPVYRLRRLVHVGDMLNRMRAQSIDLQPIHRFVADWDASSAGRATTFCNHWLVGLREHLDRYRNVIVQAKPVAALNGAPPPFAARQGTRGLALHESLNAFDRAAGYPMAWYFHLLTTRAVPHWVAISVAEDAQAGFGYLPERDIAIVRNWLHKSYAF